jgi:hypothetical protein
MVQHVPASSFKSMLADVLPHGWPGSPVEVHATSCIPTLVGGPEALWDEAHRACWVVNDEQEGSRLEPHRVAHLH